MSKIESVILGMFFGFVPIVFCFLATLVITSIFFDIKVIELWVLWLLVPGVIIDIVFLKKWVRRAYKINNKALATIYLFYSVVALGMGMGVPVFNFCLGIAAGIYSARRMHFAGVDEERRKKYSKKTAVFCAAVMVLICCLITLWAIAGQMIGYEFETPWLSFTFTVPIFFAIVFTGGAVLVLLKYWFVIAAVRVTGFLERKKMFVKILTAAAILIAIVAVLGFGWEVLQCYHAYRREAMQQRTQTEEHKSTGTQVHKSGKAATKGSEFGVDKD
ncbi:MAG: hypothetical protein ACYS0C_00215 [Planctomycetota bacterium]